jgi:hypothetical protein
MCHQNLVRVAHAGVIKIGARCAPYPFSFSIRLQ